jgi:integrase
MGWILQTYLDHLSLMVKAGQASPLTLKQRRGQIAFILDQQSEQPRTRGQRYETLPMTIPASELVAFRDRMAATPGKARNVWKTLRAAYDHATERNMISQNPARAVARPAYTSQGGATPWTLDDLEKYRAKHPPGTTAHLALTLFMFTACRIGDAVILGRGHEERHAGALWLAWQPGKKGSRHVRIPVLPPLERAIRAQRIIGPAYLLTAYGKPFASPEALRNRFGKWCAEAEIEGRTSHGIRKAAGHLLALHGATQYEITAVHGHANASTSEIYTRGYDRILLAEKAMTRLEIMEW